MLELRNLTEALRQAKYQRGKCWPVVWNFLAGTVGVLLGIGFAIACAVLFDEDAANMGEGVGGDLGAAMLAPDPTEGLEAIAEGTGRMVMDVHGRGPPPPLPASPQPPFHAHDAIVRRQSNPNNIARSQCLALSGHASRSCGRCRKQPEDEVQERRERGANGAQQKSFHSGERSGTHKSVP